MCVFLIDPCEIFVSLVGFFVCFFLCVGGFGDLFVWFCLLFQITVLR